MTQHFVKLAIRLLYPLLPSRQSASEPRAPKVNQWLMAKMTVTFHEQELSDLKATINKNEMDIMGMRTNQQELEETLSSAISLYFVYHSITNYSCYFHLTTEISDWLVQRQISKRKTPNTSKKRS